jgi:hypothetical protein
MLGAAAVIDVSTWQLLLAPYLKTGYFEQVFLR